MNADNKKIEAKTITEFKIDWFNLIDNPHSVPAINVAIIIDQEKKNRIKKYSNAKLGDIQDIRGINMKGIRPE